MTGDPPRDLSASNFVPDSCRNRRYYLRVSAPFLRNKSKTKGRGKENNESRDEEMRNGGPSRVHLANSYARANGSIANRYLQKNITDPDCSRRYVTPIIQFIDPPSRLSRE